jgi:exopolyphosphatase
LGPYVREIVDHHVDMGAHAHVQAERRCIRVTGSASSLVADRIARRLDALFTHQTATLLLGAILVDTVNLDASSDRVTALDHSAAEMLLPFVGMYNTEDRRLLFEFVQEHKFRCDHLSTRDLLRKDFKMWQVDENSLRYGISSVLLPLEVLLGRDESLLQAVVDRVQVCVRANTRVCACVRRERKEKECWNEKHRERKLEERERKKECMIE